MVLLNLALSFSVHDVSEQAIAHLAYISLRFPHAAYAGDTLSVYSTVLGVRPSQSQPDRGVVHVRTTGVNQDGVPLVTFERKALIPAGKLAGRAHSEHVELHATDLRLPIVPSDQSMPKELALEIRAVKWHGRPRGLFEDFEVDDVILHDNGRTMGESEHMQLTMLSRNSHPLHYDEVYCRERSFAGKRVICGGLVFGCVAGLASRDATANALWEVAYDRGSHPQPVLAGDTLYAASRVIGKLDHTERAGVVRFHLVGIKNIRPAALIGTGLDLFGGKSEQKVFEIERAVLLPKRSALFMCH
jgi:2-methylfumaryl-CoA hydratase